MDIHHGIPLSPVILVHPPPSYHRSHCNLHASLYLSFSPFLSEASLPKDIHLLPRSLSPSLLMASAITSSPSLRSDMHSLSHPDTVFCSCLHRIRGCLSGTLKPPTNVTGKRHETLFNFMGIDGREENLWPMYILRVFQIAILGPVFLPPSPHHLRITKVKKLGRSKEKSCSESNTVKLPLKVVCFK